MGTGLAATIALVMASCGGGSNGDDTAPGVDDGGGLDGAAPSDGAASVHHDAGADDAGDAVGDAGADDAGEVKVIDAGACQPCVVDQSLLDQCCLQ
jgi:hypothetical protein